MANQFKGEFIFADRVFRFSIDQICEAETMLDMGLGEILDRVQRGANLRLIRAVLAAAGGISTDDAAKLIENHGIVATWGATVSVVRLALPTPQDGGEADPPKEPPLPGIGSES